MNTIDLRKVALWLSGPLGFAVPAYFAFDIWQGNIKGDPNLASWLMVLILDATSLWIVIANGNKKPYTQVGWTCAAVLIVSAILSRNHAWNWGVVEYWSFGLCFSAIFFWQVISNGFGQRNAGMIAGFVLQTAAIYISFVPQVMDYWERPDPTTWYVWFLSVLGCLIGIYGAEKRDMPNTFILWACGVLNLAVWLLVIR